MSHASVNVRDYGATGNGAADDSDAFAHALDQADNVELIIPPGHYRLTRPVAIDGKNVTFRGASKQSSILFFEDCHGIRYNAGSNQFTLTAHIENLSVITIADPENGNGVHAHHGLSVKFRSNSGSTWKNCIVRNVTFAGSRSISQYVDRSNNDQVSDPDRVGEGFRGVHPRKCSWEVAVALENCAASEVENLVIRNGTVGVQSIGHSTDLVIRQCRFTSTDVAIDKKPTSEGMLIDSCFALGVGQFVVMHAPRKRPYCRIQNCHATYTSVGVNATNYAQLFIINNLFYPVNASTTVDVQLADCERVVLNGNQFIVSHGGTHNGVVLANTEHVIVQSNIIQERGAGIWLKGSTSSSLTVDELKRMNNPDVVVVDQRT